MRKIRLTKHVKLTDELRDKIDKELRGEGLTYEECINNPDCIVLLTVKTKEDKKIAKEQEGK